MSWLIDRSGEMTFASDLYLVMKMYGVKAIVGTDTAFTKVSSNENWSVCTQTIWCLLFTHHRVQDEHDLALYLNVCLSVHVSCSAFFFPWTWALCDFTFMAQPFQHLHGFKLPGLLPVFTLSMEV